MIATISLNVPALPDNDVAFSNNAAWQNYWSSIEIEATFDPIDNTVYNENGYDNTLLPVTLDIDGDQKNVITEEQFNSLLLAYETLNINYKALLAVLKTAGLLEN